MTRDEILKIVEEKRINFFRMQFCDINGFMKNVAVPRSQLEKALDGKIMFDGSSIDGFASIHESDMYLVPDYDTFVVLPWRNQEGIAAARLICDVYKPDGTPFEGCTRVNLKKNLAKAKDMGFTMNVGTEAEFFLFQMDESGKIPPGQMTMPAISAWTRKIPGLIAAARLLRPWRAWAMKSRRHITRLPRGSMKLILNTRMP